MTRNDKTMRTGCRQYRQPVPFTDRIVQSFLEYFVNFMNAPKAGGKCQSVNVGSEYGCGGTSLL